LVFTPFLNENDHAGHDRSHLLVGVQTKTNTPSRSVECPQIVTEDVVRVLLFHPWGRFDSTHCGASRTAAAHLEYANTRGWDVHCVLQEIPAWGLTAGAEELARFACVKSVRTIGLDCPPIELPGAGAELHQLLYASERAARSDAFCAIAAEPWDAFFTTDVTVAPFAHALPNSVRKVLASGDSYARRAAATTNTPPALREAEAGFAFTRVEAELYRLFNRVLFASEVDAQRARQCGANAAVHVPLLVETVRAVVAPNEHDLLVCGGWRGGELTDLEWFYRHLYLPYLRAHGVRFAVAGPVAERFAVCDLHVTKLPSADHLPARIVVSPACAAPAPHITVADALAAGRAVVTTPEGARGLEVPANSAVVIDMRADPAGTAAVIRDLLAAPGWCRLLGERAAQLAQRHARHRFFAALDSAWGKLTHVQRTHRAEAA
jgi:hypothetical protein